MILFFPATEKLQIPIRRDLVQLNIDKSKTKAGNGVGLMDVKMRCQKIREGCGHIVTRVGEGGFTGEELDAMTEFERECINTGCLDWVEAERERKILTLSSEQVTALVNEYKSPVVLLSNIKLGFVNGKIRGSAVSFFPIAPGNLNGEGEIKLGKFIEISKLYLGKIPLPRRVISFFESNGNGYIDDTFAKYNITLNSMKVEGDKLVVDVYVPEGSIEERDGKLIINLQEQEGFRTQ